jgi:hypothetical protein
MTAIELAGLVVRMRRAQKAYFRSRTPTALEESRRVEKRVDEALAEILGRSLFIPEEN